MNNPHAAFAAARTDELETQLRLHEGWGDDLDDMWPYQQTVLAMIAQYRRILEMHAECTENLAEIGKQYGPTGPVFNAHFTTWMSYQEILGALCDTWPDHPDHPGEAL